MKIISGVVPNKKKVLIHGEAGVGKTTLAAGLGKSIIVPTEDGSGHVDTDRLPLCKSYADIISSLKWVSESISSGEIDHDTVVLDSIDWAELFIEADMDREVFDRSYGKGAVEAGVRVGRILSCLDVIREQGCRVVLIAHSECKSIDLAEGGSYSRWQPKLSKRANARVQEWSDAVGFCRVEVKVREEQSGFSKRGVGVGTGRRVVHFNPAASYVAKIRSSSKVSSVIDMSDLDTIRGIV